MCPRARKKRRAQGHGRDRESECEQEGDSMDKRGFIREFTASGIKLFDLDGKLIYKGRISDISAGGVLVVSYDFEDFEDFYQGEELKFTIQLPTGEVAGIAEVMWTNPEESKMGLRFMEILNKEGVSNLMAFVADGFLNFK
jgi:hypothetical protein